MSVYNDAAFLRQSVDSILAQTYRDFEFVIVNDGSTDATAEILASYADPRLRVFHQANTGLTKALNRGLAECRGEFIARMDGGDVCRKERLAQQAEKARDAGVALVGSAVYILDECGNETSAPSPPVDDLGLRWALLFDNALSHPTYFIRRSAMEQIGGYDPHFVCSQDYDLLCRLTAVGRLCACASPLVGILHPTGERISAKRFGLQKSLAREVSHRQMRELLCGEVAENCHASAHHLVHRPWLLEVGEHERALALVRCLAEAFCRRHAEREAKQALREAFVAYARRLTLPVGDRRRQWENLKTALRLWPGIVTRKAFAAGLLHSLRGSASAASAKHADHA